MAEDLVDARSLRALLARHLEWMAVTAYSAQSIENTRRFVGSFIDWCEERAVIRAIEVTRPVLERYQRHLYQYRKHDGQPLATASQYALLAPLKSFFKWLAKQNHVLFNPAAELELPRLRSTLPAVLTVEEIEKVLQVVDVTDPLGVRDRAMLETFYSTGLRRSELIGLGLHDVNMRAGVVRVRLGKGGKERMVPIGERALSWIDKYLLEVRPSLVVRKDEPTLFLSTEGEPFTPNHLTRVVAAYVDAAELGKRGACHLFRHTAATLMLERGADIRFIQELLGHEQLSSTQVYTRVSIRALKEVHTATHPARLERKSGQPGERRTDDEALELFSSLAAETEEEESEE